MTILNERLNRRPVLLASAVLASVLAVTVSGCQSSESEGTESSSESATTTLIVGSDITSPPYSSFDGDTPVGIDPDMMNAISEAEGFDITWSDTRFAQLIPSLTAGNIQVIASALYINAERAESVDFIPYFSTGNSILVASDADPITTAEGLCGLRVAVIQGYDVINDLQDEVDPACTAAGEDTITIQEYPTDSEAAQALISDQADAHVLGTLVANDVLEATGDSLQKTNTEELFPVQVGLAVAKGDETSLALVQSGLDKIVADGTYQEILDKYGILAPDDDAVAAILGE